MLFFNFTGVGEPATCLSVVIPFAIREAIAHARQESGIPTTEWFDIRKYIIIINQIHIHTVLLIRCIQIII